MREKAELLCWSCRSEEKLLVPLQLRRVTWSRKGFYRSPGALRCFTSAKKNWCVSNSPGATCHLLLRCGATRPDPRAAVLNFTWILFEVSGDKKGSSPVFSRVHWRKMKRRPGTARLQCEASENTRNDSFQSFQADPADCPLCQNRQRTLTGDMAALCSASCDDSEIKERLHNHIIYLSHAGVTSEKELFLASLLHFNSVLRVFSSKFCPHFLSLIIRYPVCRVSCSLCFSFAVLSCFPGRCLFVHSLPSIYIHTSSVNSRRPA